MSRFQSDALILIADAFDEHSVVTCLAVLRASGKRVQLVSNLQRSITGVHGLVVEPDQSLGRFSAETPPYTKLIAIPGTHACALALLTDPRAHDLIESIRMQGGHVATLSPSVLPILSKVGLLQAKSTTQVLTRHSTDSVEKYARRLTRFVNHSERSPTISTPN